MLNVERRVGVLVVTAPGVEGLADPGLFLSAALRAPIDSLTASLGDEPPSVEGEERIARSLDVEVVRIDAVDERREIDRAPLRLMPGMRPDDDVDAAERWLAPDRDPAGQVRAQAPVTRPAPRWPPGRR